MTFLADDLKQYQGVPLEFLRRLRDDKAAYIEKERSELAKIELAIRSHERPNAQSVFSGDVAEKILTSGGSIRNLPGWVVKTLEQYGHVMTSSDLCDAMYSYSWPIEPHQFRRRIVVAASAVYKAKDPDKRHIVAADLKPPPGSRELYWALPSWMHNGRLLLHRYPPRHAEPKEMTIEEALELVQITEAPGGASNDAAKVTAG